MALQRQGPTVGVQVQSSFPIANYALDNTLAQEAQAWGTIGSIAQTGFDMVKRDFDKDQVERAQLDAPQLIQKDGQGLTLPVSTFEPPGITSRAYRDAYKTFGKSAYTVSVEQDHQNFLAGVQAKYPTDVKAAQAAMEERRNQVVSGLDPELAPLITLKLNAMNGQISSRINAAGQAETNKVAEEKGLFAYKSVLEQASRLARTPNKFDIDALSLADAQLAADRKTADELLTAAGYTPERRAHLWQRAGVEVKIMRDEQALKDFVLQRDQMDPVVFSKDLLQMRRNILEDSKKMGPDGNLYFSRLSSALSYATQTAQLQIQAQDQRVLQKEQAKDLGLISLPQMEGVTKEDVARAHEQRRMDVLTSPDLTVAQKVRSLAMADASMGKFRTESAEFAANSVTALVAQANSVDPQMTPQRRQGYVQELQQFVSDPFTVAYLPVGVRSYAQRAISQISTDSAKTDVAQTMAASSQGNIDPEDWKAWVDKNPGYFSDTGGIINMKQLRDATFANTAAWNKRNQLSAAGQSIVQKARRGATPSPEELKAIPEIPSLAFTNGGEVYDAANPKHRLNVDSHLVKTMTIPQQAKDYFKSIQFNGDPAVVGGQVEQYKSLKTILARTPNFDAERAVGFLQQELGEDTVTYLALAQKFNGQYAADSMRNRKNSASQNLGKSEKAAAGGMDGEVNKAFGAMAKLESRWETANPFSERTDEEKWKRRMLRNNVPGQFDAIYRGNTSKFDQIAIADDLKQAVSGLAFGFMEGGNKLTDIANPDLSATQIAIRRAAEGLRDQMELAAEPGNPRKGVWQYKSAETQVSELLGGKPVNKNMVSGFFAGLVEAEDQFRRSIDADPVIREKYERSKITAVPWISDDGSLYYKVQAPLPNSYGVTTLMTIAQNDPRLSAWAKDLTDQTLKDVETHWLGKNGDPPVVDRPRPLAPPSQDRDPSTLPNLDEPQRMFPLMKPSDYSMRPNMSQEEKNMVATQEKEKLARYGQINPPAMSDFAKYGVVGQVVGSILMAPHDWGTALTTNYKTQQYLEKRLEQQRTMGVGGTDRDVVGRTIGRIFGQNNLDNHSQPIEMTKVLKAMQESRDEDFIRRMRNLEHLDMLQNRASQ